MQVCEHQIGQQCKKCGHVTVPARYYNGGRYANGAEAVADHRQALEQYCKETGREYGPVVIVPEDVPEPGTNVPENGMSQVLSQKVCEGCSEGFQGYGRKCEKCRKRAQRAK